MDVASFLARFPPFDALTPERLQAVARSIDVEHFQEGATILERSGEPARATYVIRKGSVELLDDGVVVDLLSEGEVFGHVSLLTEDAPTLSVRAAEDCLCYLIPAPIAQEIFASSAGRTFVVGSMRRRIEALAERSAEEALGPRYRSLGSLIRRAPVGCEPGTTVAEAAALMASRRVSCLLVPMNDGWAIVTDRDLRTRVVAAQAPFDTPIEDIATFPAETLAATAMAGEALLEMFARGVHHFPVTGANGRLLGVVTDTDLMGLGRHTPFAIRSAIERSDTVEEAVEAARELPQVVVALVASSADPVAVGNVIALVVDGLTTRLLDLAIDRLGPTPAPWAWIALGSAARHEQALLTDQDHALAFDAAGASEQDLDPYFASLAGAVTDGLEAAGIPRCKGDAMAVHASLRRSVESWREALHGWVADPGPQGSILSSIVFDHRRVAGPLDIEPVFEEAMGAAREDAGSIRHLARRALGRTPPTGFFRGFVVEGRGEHRGELDVKHGGITIVGTLARVRAVACGSAAKRTIPRLEAAARAGSIDPEEARGLIEAFRFLWEIRLRHQTQQVRAGKAPDDFVNPETLGPVARRGLREAFRVILGAQRALANELDLRIG